MVWSHPIHDSLLINTTVFLFMFALWVVCTSLVVLTTLPIAVAATNVAARLQIRMTKA
jgi:hypothetical protein